ncbi:MAG: hypothetical protein KA974_10585 [Saprospiraceae bacterium]|nr:hypothetical protein [Saprospiraceae bacterium]
MRILFVTIFFLPSVLFAQSGSEHKSQLFEKLNRFSLSGYGAMNYYNFKWQTDTVKRNAIDNERFILDFGYRWTDAIKLNAEIEFEHGGTGSDIEFDRFEEFGEFEFEISKGGEVLLEQMNLEFAIGKNHTLKVGRVKVPFALMFKRDEPTDYLTAVISEMETQILPENWTENGFLLRGDFGKKKQWLYHIALINGLDNSAFNSANWIKRGNQRRFEMVNAENFAICTRLDYSFNENFIIGFSAYGSSTTSGNRPKPDLKIQSPIGLGDIHFLYNVNPLRLSLMAFVGALGNSEALSNQNRNLSNNLNVKRTPVGAAALGGFLEVGVVALGSYGLILKNHNKECVFYGRFDYYDTQYKTEGIIFNNSRWERQTWSVGAVYKIINQVHFKAQYSRRIVGAPAPTSINGGRNEYTFIGGFAFEF